VSEMTMNAPAERLLSEFKTRVFGMQMKKIIFNIKKLRFKKKTASSFAK